jgi:hypothetical protein
LARRARAALPAHSSDIKTGRASFAGAMSAGPRGGVGLTGDPGRAMGLANADTSQSRAILAEEPMASPGRIMNAAEAWLVPHTPKTVLADLLGRKALLPIGGGMRRAIPRSVYDDLKRSFFGYVTKSGYDALALHARSFAAYEEFSGHARAVSEVRDALLSWLRRIFNPCVRGGFVSRSIISISKISPGSRPRGPRQRNMRGHARAGSTNGESKAHRNVSVLRVATYGPSGPRPARRRRPLRAGAGSRCRQQA